jgi:hypothetical protein
MLLDKQSKSIDMLHIVYTDIHNSQHTHKTDIQNIQKSRVLSSLYKDTCKGGSYTFSVPSGYISYNGYKVLCAYFEKNMDVYDFVNMYVYGQPVALEILISAHMWQCDELVKALLDVLPRMARECNIIKRYNEQVSSEHRISSLSELVHKCGISTDYLKSIYNNDKTAFAMLNTHCFQANTPTYIYDKDDKKPASCNQLLSVLNDTKLVTSSLEALYVYDIESQQTEKVYDYQRKQIKFFYIDRDRQDIYIVTRKGIDIYSYHDKTCNRLHTFPDFSSMYDEDPSGRFVVYGYAYFDTSHHYKKTCKRAVKAYDIHTHKVYSLVTDNAHDPCRVLYAGSYIICDYCQYFTIHNTVSGTSSTHKGTYIEMNPSSGYMVYKKDYRICYMSLSGIIHYTCAYHKNSRYAITSEGNLVHLLNNTTTQSQKLSLCIYCPKDNSVRTIESYFSPKNKVLCKQERREVIYTKALKGSTCIYEYEPMYDTSVKIAHSAVPGTIFWIGCYILYTSTEGRVYLYNIDTKQKRSAPMVLHLAGARLVKNHYLMVDFHDTKQLNHLRCIYDPQRKHIFVHDCMNIYHADHGIKDTGSHLVPYAYTRHARHHEIALYKTIHNLNGDSILYLQDHISRSYRRK